MEDTVDNIQNKLNVVLNNLPTKFKELIYYKYNDINTDLNRKYKILYKEYESIIQDIDRYKRQIANLNTTLENYKNIYMKGMKVYNTSNLDIDTKISLKVDEYLLFKFYEVEDINIIIEKFKTKNPNIILDLKFNNALTPSTVNLIYLIQTDIYYQSNTPKENDYNFFDFKKLWNLGFINKKLIINTLNKVGNDKLIKTLEYDSIQNYNIFDNFYFTLLKMGAYNHQKNFNIIMSLNDLTYNKYYLIINYIKYLIDNNLYHYNPDINFNNKLRTLLLDVNFNFF